MKREVTINRRKFTVLENENFIIVFGRNRHGSKIKKAKEKFKRTLQQLEHVISFNDALSFFEELRKVLDMHNNQYVWEITPYSKDQFKLVQEIEFDKRFSFHTWYYETDEITNVNLLLDGHSTDVSFGGMCTAQDTLLFTDAITKQFGTFNLGV